MSQLVASRITFVSFTLDIFKRGEKFNSLVLCLLPLNAHDALYCIDNVKLFNILPEFASLDLCIVKQVLNHVGHELGR